MSSLWIISPKSAYSKKTISEKFSTVPVQINASSRHKWSIKVPDRILKEIDKSLKLKIHSILNLFANHLRKELIKVSQYKIPSEIPHHHFLKEANDHMQAFYPLYTNKTTKWRVKVKKSLVVTVNDQNALNFIVNASRKKYSVMKIVTVMIVVTINKISLSINRQLFKLLVEMLMVLMLLQIKKKRSKLLNKKRLNLA